MEIFCFMLFSSSYTFLLMITNLFIKILLGHTLIKCWILGQTIPFDFDFDFIFNLGQLKLTLLYVIFSFKWSIFSLCFLIWFMMICHSTILLSFNNLLSHINCILFFYPKLLRLFPDFLCFLISLLFFLPIFGSHLP